MQDVVTRARLGKDILSKKSTIMKKFVQQFTATAAVIIATSGLIPQANATAVKLDGSGYYVLKPLTVYYANGAPQTGRYQNRSLGAGYYHNVVIGIDFLTNHSTVASGSLSYEFWAMPYYQATSGIILQTNGVRSLLPGESVPNFSKVRLAVLLNARRFPEQDLWELTTSGWRFRDVLRFTSKNLL